MNAPAVTDAATPHGIELPALDRLGHDDVARRLDTDGFAVTGPLLDPGQCRQLIELFDDDAAFRSTVDMARLSFGEGRYRYFADPLPPLVAALRTRLYPPLAAIANRWAGLLGEEPFPTTRPRVGARGYHRVQMRHGVSAVHTGRRHVLGVIFHNAR